MFESVVKSVPRSMANKLLYSFCDLVTFGELGRCVNPTMQAKVLTSQWLLETVNKYKDDICDNEVDKAILCSDDLEPFLRYKYPILRLRYFTDEKDNAKKLFIMTSVLLFHCCVSSNTGMVEEDICNNLARFEKEMILKFCESLGDMEITVNNVESAIKIACDAVPKPLQAKVKTASPKKRKATPKCSNATTSGDLSQANVSEDGIEKDSNKASNLTFKSSVTVTVMSSCVTDSSSISKISLAPDSSDTMSMMVDDLEGNTTAESHELMICNVVKGGKGGDSCFSGAPIAVCADDRRPDMVPIGEASAPVIPLQPELPPCSCMTCESGDVCCAPECSECFSSTKQTTDEGRRLKDRKGKTKSKEKIKKTKGKKCDEDKEKSRRRWKICLLLLLLLLLLGGLIYALWYFLSRYFDPHRRAEMHSDVLTHFNHSYYTDTKGSTVKVDSSTGSFHIPVRYQSAWSWRCNNSLCIKIFEPLAIRTDSAIYKALSRCILSCSGPQLWPHPIGSMHYSKDIVAVATDKLEYKFQTVPSDVVSRYLAEAFKLFIGDLARLERIDFKKSRRRNDEAEIKKLNIIMEVESDGDPRMRLNTDESYSLKLDTIGDQVRININSASFCGVRHGLETLSQLILIDQTNGNLITLSQVMIKDAPSYRYRGLMLDTARHYIPVSDILRTIDGMGSCKLNTFHWRITDSASFPLLLPTLSNLFEYGSYDRAMVYTKDDVRTIVSRASVRGIRVLIEVAIPGPVGRAWSWSDDASCPTKNDNLTCDNEICIRLKMTDSVFEVLQHIYGQIIDLTGVDDIFHLSDGVFSLSNCYYLIEDREGFLERALERLKIANKGFMPLPIIWHTQHLNKETKAWESYAVQIEEYPSHPDDSLSKFRLIHSSKWDLCCDFKKQRCTKYRSWQEMYSWKSWRNLEAFSTEGGESILWTDVVDSGNLDLHLWPRAAAVAERLWSDLILNSTASPNVYIRLDAHRWRMLLRGVRAEPVWPVWCSFNPHYCISKLNHYGNTKK